ncbi:MAG: TetR/AcrR family transcriptional regulator, regulator of biofilm formation and stress response, partial [Pseudonocardiales bacterium]|nr:TetR/AcrR family transcriptional regulator, regulator of biofilm formation and stress response [Pseudonocardiales bacterium]
NLTAEEAIDQFIDTLLGSPSDDVAAQFEIYLECARRLRLQAAAHQIMASVEGAAESALRVLEIANPGDRAQMVVAMIDGLALHRPGLAARRRRPPRPAQRNSHRRRRLPGPRRTLSRNDASLTVAGPPQPVAARAGGVLWAGARDVAEEGASGLTHENCRRSNICSTHGVDGGAPGDGPEDCSAAEGVASGHEAAAAPEQLAPGGEAGRPPGSPTVRECATERPLGSESRGAVASTVTADCRERPSSHSPGQPPKCLTSPSIPAA